MGYLPCPFCGEKPHTYTNDYKVFGSAEVCCMNDDCFQVSVEKNTTEEAMEAWNIRVDTWQPIETAPRDKNILVWLGSPFSAVEYVKWSPLWDNWHRVSDPEPTESDEVWGIGSAIPTHWMYPPSKPIERL